jgi:3-phosphoshikimate 1-carboxyvinyltransferase
LKLGFVIKESENRLMEWDGERCFPANEPVIETYSDHRMAMSFAPACIPLGSITINDPEVVSKSYPNFWEDLKSAGFKIREIENK